MAQKTQGYLQGFKSTSAGRAETSVLCFPCSDVQLLLRNPQAKCPLALPTPLPKSHGRAFPHTWPLPSQLGPKATGIATEGVGCSPFSSLQWDYHCLRTPCWWPSW